MVSEYVLKSHDGESVEIIFDWFITAEQKDEVFTALKSGKFNSRKNFFQALPRNLYVELGVNEEDAIAYFSEDSYAFMKHLQDLGLPAREAAHVAMFSDIDENAKVSERIEAFDRFRSAGHTLRLYSAAGETDMDTFSMFYALSKVVGFDLALRLSRMSKDDPQLLSKSIIKLRNLKDLGEVIITEDTQIHLISNLWSLWGLWPNQPKSMACVMTLISQNKDWKNFKELRSNPDQTVLDLLSFFGIPRAECDVAVLIAIRYKTEDIQNVMRRFIKMDLSKRHPDFLKAFIAVLEHCAAGGSAEDNLTWVFSVEPDLFETDLF